MKKSKLIRITKLPAQLKAGKKYLIAGHLINKDRPKCPQRVGGGTK